MSDIVERLRDLADAEGCGYIPDVVATLREAADEIVRLRKLLLKIEELANFEVQHGTVRNERHHRAADADSQRASGDPPAVARGERVDGEARLA